MKNNIYKILLDKNMIQAELADKIGVKREYINRIINNKVNPSVILGIKIAEALETPMEKVFILNESERRKINGND